MNIHRLIRYAAITVGCWALIESACLAQTVTTESYTNSFPTDGNTTDFTGGSVASWVYWYGVISGNAAMTNDPTMDAEGQTNISGSLLVQLPFTNVGNQGVFFGTFDNQYGYDSSQVMPLNIVTQLAFDIHVDPSTVPDSSGDFGQITMALIDPTWNGGDFGYFSGITIPGSATNGWVHMVDSNTVSDILKMMTAGESQAAGMGFDYNSYGGYPTNPVTFWIDNVAVTTASIPPPPPPPPTMSMSPAIPGLNLFTGSGSGLYNRENLQASTANYSWVGATGPVSYSFTITNYSVGPNDAVQTQIFLIPNPGTETAPDYTEANLIFMDLESTTTGASVNFRYKTNEMNGNAMVYGVGTLASLGTNTAIGTWTLTFNNNTNVTMTIPGGASTNFNIPDSTGATAALFTTGVNLYFGVQAGNVGGANDHIVATDFSVTGLGAADFNDNFVADNGAVDTSIWITNAAYPNCVQLIGSADRYWIQWNSPAINYALESTSNLDNSVWSAVTNTEAFLAGTNFTQLIDTNELTGNAGFFAVVQHNLNALQVLLPGQTATPGVSPGYSGTPTSYSISSGSGVTVTVNAVDDNWNIIPSITDTVSLTSSDTAATISPASPLVAGTEQFTVFFATAGSQTVTATDTTDTGLAPAVSASITVTP
jgi:hypothetical protein